MQDGSNDLNNQHGSWPLANKEMHAALSYGGYDVRLEWGEGAPRLPSAAAARRTRVPCRFVSAPACSVFLLGRRSRNAASIALNGGAQACWQVDAVLCRESFRAARGVGAAGHASVAVGHAVFCQALIGELWWASITCSGDAEVSCGGPLLHAAELRSLVVKFMRANVARKTHRRGACTRLGYM